MTDKFKNRVGRPSVAQELKRVQLITTVSPETMSYLNSKLGANGRIIDELIKKELEK